jgi:ABC-2 type transport system permease protein
MGAFGLLYGFIQVAAYRSAAGSTLASRVAFGREMEVFARSYTFLLPLPARLDTLSGYVQWRIYGGLIPLLAVWALMSATGASRGDEERGMIEAWVSSGVGRRRYVVARISVFAVVAAMVAGVSAAGIDATALASGLSPALGPLIEQSMLLVVLMLSCYAIALALAQFPGRRVAAAGLSGIVLAALFFINSLGRTDETLRSLAKVVSPFFYMDRSSPLTPGGSVDVAGTVGLLIVSAGLAALATWLMERRDIGSPLLQSRGYEHAATRRPSRNPLLGIPVVSFLYQQRYGLLLWATGSTVVAAYVPSVGQSMVNLVKEPGSFHAYLTVVGGGDAYLVLTAYVWFGIFQLVLVAFALTNVARWSADDNEGRLEMQLSAPVSRARVMAERGLVFLASGSIVIAVSSLALYISASTSGIHVSVRNLAVASALLLPFVLAFGALGAALASKVPRAAIGSLAAVAFASYLITIAGPLLKWPDWVMNLSAFSLYGMPLTQGVYRTGLWILLAITASSFIVAIGLMRVRDVAS